MRVYAVSSDGVRSLPDGRFQQQGVIDGVGNPTVAGSVVKNAALSMRDEILTWHHEPSIVQEIYRPAHGKPKTVNAKSPARESA